MYTNVGHYRYWIDAEVKRVIIIIILQIYTSIIITYNYFEINPGNFFQMMNMEEGG